MELPLRHIFVKKIIHFIVLLSLEPDMQLSQWWMAKELQIPCCSNILHEHKLSNSIAY